MTKFELPNNTQVEDGDKLPTTWEDYTCDNCGRPLRVFFYGGLNAEWEEARTTCMKCGNPIYVKEYIPTLRNKNHVFLS